MPSAVVTGAAGGIGVAVCARLREEGWRVHGLDRHWPDEQKQDDHVVDLLDAPALEALLASLEDVELLVNNAAMMWTRPIVETDVAGIDELLATNVRAPLLAMRALHPSLAHTKGAIVNVGSVHALATSPGAALYAASKGALLALTRAAAVEFGPDVRVNAIVPGAIATPMLEQGLARDPDLKAFLTERTPLARPGRPEEIAEGVLFLADRSRSGFMTGQSLVVDGGALARLATE
jgi:NAD(P)-dependent dehydrogenase (short-subunit alcohol dehydrogenase family)